MNLGPCTTTELNLQPQEHILYHLLIIGPAELFEQMFEFLLSWQTKLEPERGPKSSIITKLMLLAAHS